MYENYTRTKQRAKQQTTTQQNSDGSLQHMRITKFGHAQLSFGLSSANFFLSLNQAQSICENK